HRAVLVRPVVVFAGGDVAGAAGEVDVRRVGGCLLQAAPGNAGEVAGNLALAAVAVGVRGVVVERGDFSRAVPETDRAQLAVDQPLGLGAHSGVAGGRPAHGLDLPVGAHDPAVRGDAIHLCAAQAQVGDGLRIGHGVADRLGGAGDALVAEALEHDFRVRIVS